MSIEAYAVSVAAKLEDGVTPGLLRIIESLTEANTLMVDFAANVRSISRLGISIGKNLKTAAAGATALGDATGGLTRASYVLDTMAASSADVVKNLRAARAESLGMGRIPGSGASGGGQGSGTPGAGSSNFKKNTALVVGGSSLFGLYENSQLQDINIMSAATAQLPISQWPKAAGDLREQEFAYARKYAFATGGKVEPFAEAMLESSRLLRTLPADKQQELTSAAMPYAAIEAKLKGIALPDSMRSFIELAHMAGAYDPKDAKPLFESMMQASLTTHMSLEEITRAASYALPSIHAAGANSNDVLLLLATMMQSGILNTKSGTWINNMALNALPNTLGSGLFKNKLQNQALHELGLYRGNKAMFYKNGNADLMLEASLFAQARQKMTPEHFNATLKLGLGTQGMRAAAIFSEPQVLANIGALANLAKTAQNPVNIGQAIQTLSNVGQADQTIANARMTIMNMTETAMGPAGSVLGKASDFFGWTAKQAKDHPILSGVVGAGLGVGIAALMRKTFAMSAAKGAAEMAGKKLLDPLGKSIITFASSLIANPIVARLLGLGAVGVGSYEIATALGAGKLGAYVGGKIYDWTHPDNQHVVAPPPRAQPVQVHTQINVDGKKVAQAVTQHQAREAGRPYSGASGFDTSMNLAPVSR